MNPALPPSDLRAEVDAALLKMAFARLRMSVLLTAVVCVVFVVLFWSYFPSDAKLTWVVFMLVVSALRYGLWSAYAAASEPARHERRWRLLFIVSAWVAGASWAYGPIMLMPAAGHIETMLLVLAIFEVCAVSMSAMVAQAPAMVGFQFTAIVPTIWALLATGGDVERLAGAVLFAGMVTLMIVGRTSSASTRSMVESQLRLTDAAAQTSAARDRAEAASHAKTRFLANMSHELRTPLNAVIGAAQLMKAGEQDAGRKEQLVDAIQRSGNNLLGLIENILDLSRIEAGELQLAAQDFHLFDCIDAALATAGLAARAKGLRLACIVDPTLPPWRHADASRLRQVMLNLLGNAVKFTEMGEVVVRLEHGPVAGQVRITISDTGVGIGESALAHVFEPFRQADDSAGRRFGGSGLGLAIVRELAQAMGGEVSVQSRLGAGSVFELLLPLPPAHTVRLDVEPARGCVAFFEPHGPSAEALQALLLRMGFRVHRCAGPQDIAPWCHENADTPEPAWLLVCTDSPQSPEVLEQARLLADPTHVIGMSGREHVDAALLGERFRLLRNLVKPVSRSALASQFIDTSAVGDRPVTAPMALEPAGDAGPRPATHVLVVEDDMLNQVIVSRLLQHAGYRVSVVPDGHSALATLREQQFDLVLMDWQMPDMDGLEVTRRMRAGEAGADAQQVPVVALTANAFAEDRDACLAAGMNDYLTKPVLAGSLTAAVERWVPRTGSGHASDASRS